MLLCCIIVASEQFSYIAGHELSDHAEYEVSPEYVQKLEHQQHGVEEVVSKESRVLQNRVHPSTVDEPKNTGVCVEE